MKRSSIILALFLLAGAQAKAQKEVLFKIKYLPNHIYTSVTNMNMDMEMNYDGDSAVVSKIKASGMKLPILMKMEMGMNSDIKTSAYNAQKEVPFVMSLQIPQIKMTVNGTPTPVPGGATTQTIMGKYTADNKFELTSLEGKAMTDSAKKAIMKTIETLTANIEFPNKVMKVGDTFTQNTPMDMPIPGFSDKLNIKVTYKLISVAYGKANFDMNFDMGSGDANGPMKGSGDGKFVYDIANNYAIDMHENMNMTYALAIPQQKMTMKGQMKILMQQQTTFK